MFFECDVAIKNMWGETLIPYYYYKKLAPVLLGEIAVGKGLVVFGVVAVVPLAGAVLVDFSLDWNLSRFQSKLKKNINQTFEKI